MNFTLLRVSFILLTVSVFLTSCNFSRSNNTSNYETESSGEMFYSSESYDSEETDLSDNSEVSFDFSEFSSNSENYSTSEENIFLSSQEENESSLEEIISEESIDESPEDSLDESIEVSSSEGFIEPEGFTVTTPNGNVFETNCKNEKALSIMGEIADTASKYNKATVYYTDTEQKYFFAFGAENIHNTASTIKAPYATYILKSGADLSEVLVMEKRHVHSGSGVLKNKAVGSKFTVEELIGYMIRRSDNTAYAMLLERFGTSGFREYAKSLDINYRLPESGYTTCTIREMASFLLDIYRYEGTENGDFLIKQMKNCSYSLQIPKAVSYPVAHKFGFIYEGKGFHDMAIVYAPTPYLELIFTRINGTVYDTEAFLEIGKLVESLNKELSEKY